MNILYTKNISKSFGNFWALEDINIHVPKGSIFGWDHQLSQVIFNRMNNDKFEGIDNVYLVGAWGSPGGGQSAVMVSGYTTAQKILRKENGDEFQDSMMSFFVKVVGFFTGIFY